MQFPVDLNGLLAQVKVQEGGVGEGRDSVGSLTLEALAKRVEECSEDNAGGAAAGGGGSGGGATEEKEEGEDEQMLEEKRGALVLALHGWEAVPPPQQQQSGGRGGEGGGEGGGWALACGMCGRRVEAGRVVDRRSSLGSGRVMEGGEEGARAKARRVGGTTAFDVVNQHRWWCAWVSRGLDEKGQPGWRQTLKALVGRMRRVVEVGGVMEEEGGGSGGGGGWVGASSSYSQARRLLESM